VNSRSAGHAHDTTEPPTSAATSCSADRRRAQATGPPVLEFVFELPFEFLFLLLLPLFEFAFEFMFELVPPALAFVRLPLLRRAILSWMRWIIWRCSCITGSVREANDLMSASAPPVDSF